jgi:hypothetical protein
MMSMNCDCQSGSFGPTCTTCPTCPTNEHCLDGYNSTGACACNTGFTRGANGVCQCSDPRAYGPTCSLACPLALPPNTNCSAGVNGTGVICAAPYLSFVAGGGCDCTSLTSFGAGCSSTCAPLTNRSTCVAGTAGTGTTCRDTTTFVQTAPNDGTCSCAIPGDFGVTCQLTCMCGAGSYCSGGFAGAGCVQAPPGSYVNATGALLPCPLGTRSSAYGASTCPVCRLGTYANATGATVCQSCPTAGTYALDPTSSVCTVPVCTAYTDPAVCGSLSAACHLDGLACVQGLACDGISQAIPCQAQLACVWSAGGMCQYFHANCSAVHTEATCLSSRDTWDQTCEFVLGVGCRSPCFSPSFGAACDGSCTTLTPRSVCSSGYGGTGTTCTGNTLQTAPNNGSCPCVPGVYGLTCQNVCNCTTGQTCSDGVAGTGCVDCQPGTGSCASCAVGSFASTPSALACDPCAPNTYANVTGSTVCHACPDGWSSPQGSASCTACPAGTGGCVPCSMGTFAGAAGAAACTPCPMGTFSNETGATACFDCVPGSVALVPSNGVCVCLDAAATWTPNGCVLPAPSSTAGPDSSTAGSASSTAGADSSTAGPDSSTAATDSSTAAGSDSSTAGPDSSTGGAESSTAGTDSSTGGAESSTPSPPPPFVPDDTTPSVVEAPFWDPLNTTAYVNSTAEADSTPTTITIHLDLDLTQIADLDAFAAAFLVELSAVTGFDGASVNSITPGSTVVNVTVSLTAAQILQQFVAAYTSASVKLDPATFPLFARTQQIVFDEILWCTIQRQRSALLSARVLPGGAVVNATFIPSDGLGDLLRPPTDGVLQATMPVMRWDNGTIEAVGGRSIVGGVLAGVSAASKGAATLTLAAFYFAESVTYNPCPNTNGRLSYTRSFDPTCVSGLLCTAISGSPATKAMFTPVCNHGMCGCKPNDDGSCDLFSVPVVVDTATTVCVAGTSLPGAEQFADVCTGRASTADHLEYINATNTALNNRVNYTFPGHPVTTVIWDPVLAHDVNWTYTTPDVTVAVLVPTSFNALDLTLDECARRDPTFINLFPLRRYCQSREFSFGTSRTMLRGVFGNPFADSTAANTSSRFLFTLELPIPNAAAFTRNAGLLVRTHGYVSTLYGDNEPVGNRAWALIEYSSLLANDTVQLTRLMFLDSVEGAPDWYFRDNRWQYKGCPPYAYAYYDPVRGVADCDCFRYYALNSISGLCEPGCNNGNYGLTCDQPLTVAGAVVVVASASGKRSVVMWSEGAMLVNYAGTTIVCMPGYVQQGGQCVLDAGAGPSTGGGGGGGSGLSVGAQVAIAVCSSVGGGLALGFLLTRQKVVHALGRGWKRLRQH